MAFNDAALKVFSKNTIGLNGISHDEVGDDHLYSDLFTLCQNLI